MEKAGGGIAARLAALKKNGEENWKKRVPTNDVNSLDRTNANRTTLDNKFAKRSNSDPNNGNYVVVELRRKPIDVPPRATSIHDRLSKLEVSQQTWQKKVVEKDASGFTVAGKMEREFKSSTEPVEKEKIPPIHETQLWDSIITPDFVSFKGEEVDLNLVNEEDEEERRMQRIAALNVDLDSEVDPFFVQLNQEEGLDSKQDFAELNEDNFDWISDSVAVQPNLGVSKRIVRPGKQKASRNPVKNQVARNQISQLEAKEDVEEEKSQITGSNKQSHLASEALAGLASTEDFSRIQLKRNGSDNRSSDLNPFKSLMLIQLKGRRFCQPRLLPPCGTSINSGDAYILVTPNNVMVWLGKFSNVIERSRAAEIGQAIFKRKDLGFKQGLICTLDEEICSSTKRSMQKFWQLLEVSDADERVAAAAGPAEEDANFESSLQKLTRVWEVSLSNGYEELRPLTGAWGHVPKVNVLDKTKVLVFDFGCELYVWTGSCANPALRRAGVHLLDKVWDAGVAGDFPGERHLTKGSPRPQWAVKGKVSQKMETVLFREKFVDWPDDALTVIKVKLNEVNKQRKQRWTESDLTGQINFEAVDALQLLGVEEEDPNLKLEGSFLGRGSGYYDHEERRQYEVCTLKIKAWHVCDQGVKELEEDWPAQFYSRGTYVVRWGYKVSLTGRDLKGLPSKHAAVGRDRTAYFFWQGAASKTSEQGTSALMTMNLDKEESPQIRVLQGKEPAAFLRLWQGRMVIHEGKFGCPEKIRSCWRMFAVRGECEEETVLVQVESSRENLRSRASFILVNNSTEKVLVWQGSASPKYLCDMAIWAATNLCESPPIDFQMKSANLHTVDEGEETELFFEAISGKNTYVENFSGLKSTPRLFHLTTLTGVLEAKEILCPFRDVSKVNMMPFEQKDLYEEEQPTLFFLDTSESCWLWQGFFPKSEGFHIEEENDNNVTGSCMIRWHAERRAAMETVERYIDIKYKGAAPPAKLVWAGCEPLKFIAAFPTWKHNPRIEEDNREHLKNDCLVTTLMALSRTEYSWKELQERPLPDGVDPARLETYLSDQDFEQFLGLTRKEFNQSPRWKQLEIRKEKDLF